MAKQIKDGPRESPEPGLPADVSLPDLAALSRGRSAARWLAPSDQILRLDHAIAALRDPLFALTSTIVRHYSSQAPSGIVIEDTSARFIGLFVSQALKSALGRPDLPVSFVRPPGLLDADPAKLSAFSKELGGLVERAGDRPLVVTEYVSMGRRAREMTSTLIAAGATPTYCTLMMLDSQINGGAEKVRAELESAGLEKLIVGRIISDPQEAQDAYGNRALNGVVARGPYVLDSEASSASVTSWAEVGCGPEERLQRRALIVHSRARLFELLRTFQAASADTAAAPE